LQKEIEAHNARIAREKPFWGLDDGWINGLFVWLFFYSVCASFCCLLFVG
jgi:hypothetical protein